MRGIKIATNKDMVELKDFVVLKGEHCESSAMMNALNYHGAALSENMINGFASSMSFGFGGDDKFPMILMRVGDLKERFSKTTGMKIVEGQPQNPQEAYDRTKRLLSENIAVVLRVNMRYLPYLHGGKYGSKYTSFGWHFITLVKLDEVQGYALVTDTSCDRLQKIKIADLAKARDSKEGELKADNYFYFFDNPQIMDIDFENAFKKSLESLIRNYESDEGILNQLKDFPDEIENIEQNRNVFMLSPMFFTWYGFIEEFGTGGSGFRNFLHKYLLEMRDLLKYNELEGLIDVVCHMCNQWKEIAYKFKSISQEIAKIRKKEAREAEYKKAAEIAHKVYGAELKVYNELKEVILKLN